MNIDFMNIDKERLDAKVFYLCVLAAICVLIIAVIVLIGIWSPKDKKAAEVEKVDTSIGKFQIMSVSNDDKVSSYSDEIMTYFATKNMDMLYKKTNTGYLKYFNLDKEGLKKVLQEKDLYGTTLTSTGYNLSTFKSNNYIKLKITTPNTTYIQDSINIIEESPNNFTIAFDGFVSYDDSKKEFLRDGLKITINSILAFDTKYTISLSLTNNTQDDIYLNTDKNIEFIYLLDSSSNKMNPSTHIYANEQVVINQGKTINLNLSYAISDMSAKTITSLIIKDVKIGKTGALTDIEIDL